MMKPKVRILILPFIALIFSILACYESQTLGDLALQTPIEFTVYGEVPNEWHLNLTPGQQYEITLVKNTTGDYPLSQTTISILIEVFSDQPISYIDDPITFVDNVATMQFTAPAQFSTIKLVVNSKICERAEKCGTFTLELHEVRN